MKVFLRRWRLAAGLLVAVDAATRLGVPASFLAFAKNQTSLAVGSSIVFLAASVARAHLRGYVVEASLRDCWARVTEAATQRSILSLRVLSKTEEGAAVVFDCVRETALYEATIKPQLVGLLIALASVLSVALVELGPRWLLLGASIFVPVGLMMVWGHSRLRSAQALNWKMFGRIMRDVTLLIGASPELRAHGREGSFVSEFLERVRVLAKSERRVSSWSAAIELIPVGMMMLAVTAPAQAGVAWIRQQLAGEHLIEVGGLGGFAVMFSVGIVRTIQAAACSAPHRKTFRDFVQHGLEQRTPPTPTTGRVPLPALVNAEIAFESVSYRYDGALDATPYNVSYCWRGHGLAVTGENGAGKSTLALVLLGLLPPTKGCVRINGIPLETIDPATLHRRVAYIPQNPFFDAGESIEWHLSLYNADAVSRADMKEALHTVGLYDVLEAHVARDGRHPVEVAVGELSGGERQRLHLAQALIRNAELLIFDEPEVGIDEGGRAKLRALLALLSAERRVLLIAHDTAVVPEAFEHLQCVRSDEQHHPVLPVEFALPGIAQ